MFLCISHIPNFLYILISCKFQSSKREIFIDVEPNLDEGNFNIDDEIQYPAYTAHMKGNSHMQDTTCTHKDNSLSVGDVYRNYHITIFGFTYLLAICIQHFLLKKLTYM